jgi:GNAT superfamily N-acetyltransferase
MSWRACGSDEHERVAALMLALYTEDPAPTQITAESGVATLRRLQAEPLRGSAVVYATEQGLMGYALLCSFWSNELGGEVCIIDELYVVPEARKRGVASQLIGGLSRRELPWFESAVAVELEVTPDNAPARALYERLGFAAYKNALMRLRRAP